MKTIKSKDRNISLDDEGFLEDSRIWDEDVAHILAQHEGIEKLDQEKLEIVKFLREYFEKHHSFPILGNVCRHVGAKSKDCVAKGFSNPMTAWKIAGLPKPPSIFFTTFDGKNYIPNPFY